MVGFNFAAQGYALCSGQLLSIAENDALFALIGTTYGGDGQVTFGLPDLRGRMPIHQGQGPGLSNNFIGQAAGAENVTLLPAQMPQHTHALLTQTVTNPCHSGAGDSKVPTGNYYASSSGAENYATASDGAMGAIAFNTTVAQAGESQPHDNMSPFLCVSFLIALEGIFPSRS